MLGHNFSMAQVSVSEIAKECFLVPPKRKSRFYYYAIGCQGRRRIKVTQWASHFEGLVLFHVERTANLAGACTCLHGNRMSKA
mmetsp:Transcript_47731/g.101436  ORF Transcript_47731/g.101436 Transcript_47731/m.101436 type:complete len:83 (-) Transcript_47731:1147-1395(-)